MSIWQAIILGLIQGLTEFLPVSSSGHLELGRTLLGLEAEDNLLFTVVVHGATVLSTIVALWPEIVKLLRGLFAFKWNWETQYIAKLLLSMVPIAIVGFLFKDTIESFFTGNIVLVGSMLLLTAVLLGLTYFVGNRPGHAPTYGSALLMGVGQALAALPGLSRSGTTISVGLLAGVDKKEAAQFSFLMVLPPIIGMNLLDLLSGEVASSAIGGAALVAGAATAFITGYFACRWMIRLVQRGKLIWFALYCAVVGAIALIASLI